VNKETKPFFTKEGIMKKIRNGYIYVKYGDKWMQEHRLVVENFIGRTLEKGETVHHINFNKKNNNLDNLFPFHTQREHKSFENRVKQFGMTNPILKEISERFDGWK
jgi:hypothetical protein